MISSTYDRLVVEVWSGWRELDSHSTPDSQIKIILCNINWFNQVTKNFIGLFHLNLILFLSPKVTLIYFLPYRLLQYQNSVNNKIIFTTFQVKFPHIVKQTKFWYILGSPNTPKENLVKHLLIILSIFIFSSFLTSCDKKEGRGVLYFGFRSGEKGYYDEKWQGVKNKDNYNINKFEGEFKDGEPNGQGTYTWSDGKKYVGEWKKGNYWNGNSYDKNGNFVRRYVNGEPQ